MIRPGKAARLILGAIAALALSAGGARATYLVQVTSTVISPPGTVTVDGSTVTIASFVDNPSNTSLGSPSAPTAQIFATTSITNGGNLDTFTIPVEIALKFTSIGGTDATTATIDMKGTLSGQVGPFLDTLTFSPTSGLSTTAFTEITVGGQAVDVEFASFTPPGSPPESGVRDFAVLLYSGPSPNAIPEPTAFALVGVGGLLLLAPTLRRRVRRIGRAALGR